MANDDVIHLTESSFETEVLKSDKPVLVDFWAPWCAPCRAVGQAVDELATEYAGQVKVAKINTDDEMALAQRFHVMSIPTVLVFRGGQVVDQQVGAVPKPRLVEMIQKAMG
jgi:thioredoxin 1